VPRTLLGFAAVAALALPCLAGQAGSTSEMVIRLDVRPAPAPTPALRYRLLPELKDMKPGNPIQGYMKCMMGQQKFLFDEEASRHRETLLAMPLKELPAQELDDYGRLALKQADQAARLDTPDWQILLKMRDDGIGLLLPEVQQIRSLARALQVRYRAEIAQGRFDDALRTAQTMFAISRHLGEHPTLIGGLVGMAISSLAISGLEEMLEQPGCPNLYWALTSLPRPLIPLDKGMEGERVMHSWAFRDLDDDTPMSKDRLDKFITDTGKLLELAEGKPAKPGLQAWLDARTEDEALVGAAIRRLVEYGLPEERLERFPPDQVILLDEKLELEVRFDDLAKTLSFPAWQAEGLAARAESKQSPALFADVLMPGLSNVRHAQGRIDQRIGLLRHVEALRLHSAEHDGALPAELSDVSVPLPLDPFTGKPFRYEVAGDTAHLRGSPPSGKESIPQYNIHYEVTLQE
jgi:hypothetical protein